MPGREAHFPSSLSTPDFSLAHCAGVWDRALGATEHTLFPKHTLLTLCHSHENRTHFVLFPQQGSIDQ